MPPKPRISETLKRKRAKHKKAGEFLREARIRRGLTIKEALTKIGLTNTQAIMTIMRVEHGSQRLSFVYMDDLCAVYGVDSVDVRRLYAQVEIDRILKKFGLK